MTGKIGKALKDPMAGGFVLWSKMDPRGLLARYARLAREAGLDRLYFLLSFDCDTSEDIATVWDVHMRLRSMGVKPMYAVPGELLVRGAEIYRRLYDDGAEFLNHGYKEHTYFDSDRNEHASCFFYNELPREIVREDIVRGDATLREVLGAQPRGFRTPHFGTFQTHADLSFLHDVLRELGYAFSSSTIPLYAFRYGPLVKERGLAEIPVSGMGSAPLKILDTWSCFRAPGRTLAPRDYYVEGNALATALRKMGVGVLNYYGDPSHISRSDEFFDTVRSWLAVAEPVTFSELLESTRWNGKS
jgi:hypothetical protein